MKFSSSKLLILWVMFFPCIGYSTQSDESESKSVNQQKQVNPKVSPSKKLYRHVDNNGKVYYSDQPSAGAKEINIEPVTSIKMEKIKVDLEGLVEENQIKRGPNAEYYNFIGFQGLENDGVVRNNGGFVTFTVSIDPELSKAHFLRFFIDGKQVGEKQKALIATVKDIEYGSHSTYFEVVSGGGKVVQKSETIQFNLLHIVRRNANSINNVTNDYFNKILPQHPKLPTYDSKKKSDQQ
ncbi:MAG: DUF4124 domain-containing protein [Kangiellaceae bacterium]|nr:DUF4124 domain-containing protein [Kangiellaceae bacterium]